VHPIGFTDATRCALGVLLQLAGYITQYQHGLTYMTFKGNGHLVPKWQPREALVMISAFLTNRTGGLTYQKTYPGRDGRRRPLFGVYLEGKALDFDAGRPELRLTVGSKRDSVRLLLDRLC
jgi:Serine carboxypeptidase